MDMNKTTKKQLIQKDFPIKVIKDMGMMYPSIKSTQKTRYAMFECPLCKSSFVSIVRNIKKSYYPSCQSCKNKTHGGSKSKLYTTWLNMRARCTNKNREDYKYYGMRDITKSRQLKKNRQPNPKRMPQVELQLFKDFIFDKADGKCQGDCNRPIATYHHAERGSNKDDRSLGGICEVCHYDLHFSIDSRKREALTILFKSIGIENYREYCE